MSFTIHFIDDKWKLKTFCLDTVPVLQYHTGQNLAEAVEDILANWELDPANLICATTDNGSKFQHSIFWTGWGSAALGTIWIFVSTKPYRWTEYRGLKEDVIR